MLASALTALPALTPTGAPAVAQTVPVSTPPASGGVAAVALSLVGSSNLASPGVDGQTKPRENNGDVATLKNIAYVGGGSHG